MSITDFGVNRCCFETGEYGTNEFSAVAGAKPASNGAVLLEVPGIFFGTKLNLGLPAKLGEGSPISGFRGDVVRLNNSSIYRGENVFQAVKLNLHSEGALSEIVEHGILVLEPDDEPVGDGHTLAFLGDDNCNRIRKYSRARQPTMPKISVFPYHIHFIKILLMLTTKIISYPPPK